MRTPYTFTLNGKDIKEEKEINIELKRTSPYDDEIKQLSEHPAVLYFEQSGTFPGVIQVEVPVEKEDGEYLLLYYNPKEQKAEYVQKVEVKDGQTKFLIEKGGAYFIDKRASTKSLKDDTKEKDNFIDADTDEIILQGTKEETKSLSVPYIVGALIACAVVVSGLGYSFTLKRDVEGTEMVMKHKVKRVIGLLLIAVLMSSVATGCGKTTLTNTVQNENKQKDSDAWMEDDASGQKDTDKSETSKEEEYYDVDKIQGGEVDYSKYEEKKSSRAASGNSNSNVTYSDGTGSGQDQYQTNPVPEGMQNPVEPGEITIDKSKKQTCYLTISCATILDNMENLTEGKEKLIPSDGVIYATRKVTFYEGESVFDVLLRETKNNRVHMEYSFNPLFNSNYIEAINNLYEFDCGQNSGWMYNVNGWYPNYGCSRYIVQEGDEIQWNYTCDLGRDLGTSWMDQNGER